MGNRNSAQREDKKPLLVGADVNVPDCVLFEELNLVVIGSHFSGKNEVANAILQNKVFRSWGYFCKCRVKKGGEINKRKIEVVRAPGWSGDLHAAVNKQKKTKLQIVSSVQSHFEKGPHAVLLALDVDSTITEATRKTLEVLLTEKVWDHTIVIFTHGEKNKDTDIKDQIRVNQLDEFIERCGKRYFVLKKNTITEKQNTELIDTIEYFIANKDSSVQFCLSDSDGAKDNDLEEKKSLIKRLENKIDKLKRWLSSQTNHGDNSQRLLDLKDAEIAKLQAVLQKREAEIHKLRGLLAQKSCPACEAKDKEIGRLLKQINEQTTHRNIKYAKHQSTQTGPPYRRHTETKHVNNSVVTSHRKQTSDCNSFEMMELTSGGRLHEANQDFLRNWTLTLNDILAELSEDQLNKMKHLLKNGRGRRIPAGQLESQDRDSMAELLVQTWGEHQCIINTRDIMKEIPRNDKIIQDLFQPYLKHIGETW
ncbi:GTPase IMAP family member 9-like [Hoplias malabaricus]|uniref:GTPase IMAP family member 9-like n=1 Tax=Hoplias malabaricus TaxID=27720 RepID=UPI003461D361